MTAAGDDKLVKEIEEALDTAVKEAHISSTFNPIQSSQLLLELNQFACSALVKLAQSNTLEMEKYCEAVLKSPGGEDFMDALVARADVLMKKEEWDQAVANYENAFNKSGRSSQEVSDPATSIFQGILMLIHCLRLMYRFLTS